MELLLQLSDVISSTTSPTTSPTIFTIFKATTTKVAAFGRHHKRGGAAFGRATSFVVSFVVVVNRVNIVAVNTILVLHLGKTGRSVGRTDFGLDGWSAGLGCPMDGRQDGRTNEWSGGLGNARRCSAVLDGSKIMKITSSRENGLGQNKVFADQKRPCVI